MQRAFAIHVDRNVASPSGALALSARDLQGSEPNVIAEALAWFHAKKRSTN